MHTVHCAVQRCQRIYKACLRQSQDENGGSIPPYRGDRTLPCLCVSLSAVKSSSLLLTFHRKCINVISHRQHLQIIVLALLLLLLHLAANIYNLHWLLLNPRFKMLSLVPSQVHLITTIIIITMINIMTTINNLHWLLLSPRLKMLGLVPL